MLICENRRSSILFHLLVPGDWWHTVRARPLYWEMPPVFGPGSDTGPTSTYGCVHLQKSVAAQLYVWADIGTSV
jgi:hypothetical protein